MRFKKISPFVSGSTADVAIVYGTGVGRDSSDVVQATNIQTDLEAELPAGAVTAAAGAEGEVEDEVVLGGAIDELFSSNFINTPHAPKIYAAVYNIDFRPFDIFSTLS